MRVIKKSGEREDWSDQKIRQSILNASQDAGIPMEEAEKLVKNVMEGVIKSLVGKEEATTYLIRYQVLKELDRLNRLVSDAWRIHENKK